MKNRIILGLLALLLAVGCFGTLRTAQADDTIYTEGTLYYTIINESITIVGCFGKDEEVEVPAMIAGIPVNTIATGAFMENEYIKTLKLPDTISKIERDAIADWIYVIYNANTDHPQDYPTDLILGNLDPVTDTPSPEPVVTPEIGSGSEDLPDDTPAPTEAPTDKPAETQKPSDAAKATATPKPTPDQGDETTPPNIGEVDIDLTEDDTPEPTGEPTEAPAPETQAPVAEATGVPIVVVNVTPAPTDKPAEPKEPTEPEQKNLTWLWVALGAVAAGGAATGIVVAKKGKKK